MKQTFAGMAIALVALSSVLLAQKAGAPAVTPRAGAAGATAATRPLVTEESLSGLAFRNIGPANMSGRISDIVIHPTKHQVWYVAVGSGGVWKTENAGTTWTPIFDHEGAYSIGCVTLDPRNPDTIWVGTGENVSGRHVGIGDGVYKSLNGGRTWTNTGLRQSDHIARILVDPRNSDVVYAAAEGPLWSSGGDRGLYKTVDGGATWTPSLQIDKDTGVTSVELDPSNPDTLYAAAYQRRRSVAAFMAGGPSSGIYKSTDAGKTWRKLTVGLPTGDRGKIGLALSPQDPRVVYATIEASADEKGFYRSADRGESWEKRNAYTAGGTGPHYYQEIFADPTVFDRVYEMDAGLRVTDDGGRTWRRVPERNKHGDNHAMAFIPGDPGYILNGSDGGVYETHDGGATWRFFENLPVSQFYKVALDNALPFYNVHGGIQDNGSQLGPSRTVNASGIGTADWVVTAGADGYSCAIDPTDPDVLYVEWQQGSLMRYDRRSRESVSVSPRPGPGDGALRFNWDSPVVISPHSHTRLYYASQYVWRSDDRGNSWTRISPDLTRNVFRLEQPIMGRTWSADALWDHGAMSMYSTISALSESPLVAGLIYAGTDDGLVQATEDGGRTWRVAGKLPGVPEGFFVNRIQASRLDKDVVFVVVDRHKSGDYRPYLLRSDDRGRTWTSIVGDLPARGWVWSIAQDHVKKDLLFAGTEYGIYCTLDGGRRWVRLSGGLPTISFRDVAIQAREDDLVGGSFGRSVYVLDDYSPLRLVSEQALASDALLFPVRKALLYVPQTPLGSGDKGTYGDTFFTAPNPPFGAIFTYYLREPLRTAAEARREREKAQEKAGTPVTFPGWDALRAEQAEEKPEIVLTVTDETGQVVRRVTGPVTQGLHRVAWDLRYPPVDPTEVETRAREMWEGAPQGPLVVPGRFTVTLAKRVGGVLTPLAEPRSFVVESLHLATFEEKDRRALLAFQQRAGALQRAMMGAAAAVTESLRNIEFMKKALADTPKADPALGDDLRAVEKRLKAAMVRLAGDPAVLNRSEAAPPSLMDRVDGQLGSTSPITATVERDYDIAAAGFETLLEEMRVLVEVDLAKIGQRVEAAGAPWTPGRGVPRWKR